MQLSVKWIVIDRYIILINCSVPMASASKVCLAYIVAHLAWTCTYALAEKSAKQGILMQSVQAAIYVAFTCLYAYTCMHACTCMHAFCGSDYH